MSTGLGYVLEKLREIRDLAADAPRVPQTLTAEALSNIANMTDRLLRAIEGPTTLARQIGERLDANAPHEADYITCAVSRPGTVAIGAVRDQIVAFVDEMSAGDYHGIEHLIHETLHARRAPDPEVEARAQRIMENVRSARVATLDALMSGQRTAQTTERLQLVRDKLAAVLHCEAAAPDPAAVRARLVELTDAAIGKVWGNDEMGIEDTPHAIIGVIESMAGADAMEELLLRELQSRAACRAEMQRQARISAALRLVTDEHLRPALAEFGIALPENYVLEWRETGDVVPGE